MPISRPPVDVVVITALEVELRAVVRQFDETDVVVISAHGVAAHRGRIRNAYINRDVEVVAMQTVGVGNSAAVLAVSRAIDVWNPSHIFLVGIAGGVKSKDIDSLGDIVVADQIIGYELGKVRESGIERRWEVFRPSFGLLATAREVASGDWWRSIDAMRPSGAQHVPKVHFCAVASGEKVITSEAFVNELRSTWSKLAAVEMEGYGTALTAYASASRTGFILLKAISDWADSQKTIVGTSMRAVRQRAFSSKLFGHLVSEGPRATKTHHKDLTAVSSPERRK